jgi:hypothetical protein
MALNEKARQVTRFFALRHSIFIIPCSSLSGIKISNDEGPSTDSFPLNERRIAGVFHEEVDEQEMKMQP